MRISSVTFSIGRTMPLQPISRRPEDAYANVKPTASCTVLLDEGDDVDAAKTLARDTAFAEMQNFSRDFREMYRTAGTTDT